MYKNEKKKNYIPVTNSFKVKRFYKRKDNDTVVAPNWKVDTKIGTLQVERDTDYIFGFR